MTIAYNRVAGLLSANHMLADNPTTDNVEISVPGPSANAEVWKTHLAIGYRADFDSIAIQSAYSVSAPGQAPSAFPGTVTGSGSAAWQTPGNVVGDTASYAEGPTQAGTPSSYLICTNFGFSIPAGATILGVKVETEGYSILADEVKDLTVELFKYGGAGVGENRAKPESWALESPVWRTYGGLEDLWSAALSPTDVNDVGFGAGIQIQYVSGGGGGVAEGRLSRVKISVAYLYTDTIATKLQINPNGLGWEDIPGSSIGSVLRPAPTEASITISKQSSDFTNNDLPADIRLVCTATQEVRFNIFTLQNAASVAGNSVAGSGSNYPFDWPQYIKSAKHKIGNTTGLYQKQIDNPAGEVIFSAYIAPPPGVVTLNTLEMNCSLIGSVDSGTQSLTIAFQIKPVGETAWKDAMSTTATLTTTPTALNNMHADLLPSDFTGWVSGLKAPFDFQITITATGTGKTFTFNINDDHNNCRLRGTVD